MENNRCIGCKNYLGDLSCMAFIQIPESILTGENDHTKPLPEQDNDIVFEEIEQDEQ